MKIGFIGAGQVASALAPALVGAGHNVAAVSSRTSASARRLRELAGLGCRAEPTAQAVADGCDLVFVTTPDDVIAGTAEAVRWRAHHHAVHCSGALSSRELAPVRLAGGQAASFHPLQTFAAPEARIQGITFAIEGDQPLTEVLKAMAHDLGGRWIDLPADGKPLYHVAGVLVSNYTVTLMEQGTTLLRALGVSEAAARDALIPLLRGTVENIERVGVPACLTGPAARGDARTIGKHLTEIGERAPEIMEAYRALGLLTVPIAEAGGGIDGGDARDMRELFAGRLPVAGIESLAAGGRDGMPAEQEVRS